MSPSGPGTGPDSGGGPAKSSEAMGDAPTESGDVFQARPRRPQDGEGAVLPAKRFWSTRRVPAGVVALILFGTSGLLLYDVASVRADQPGMEWRRWLGRKLNDSSLQDAWVLGVAATAAAVGLWLLVLAVTPGLRRVLPMRRDAHTGAASGPRGAGSGTGAAARTRGPEVRAGIDRKAAALVLRDRGMEVQGVRSVKMGVGRRKIRARAQAHFRDLDEVRKDLDEALSDGVRQLGLARRPKLSVRVRRPAKK